MAIPEKAEAGARRHPTVVSEVAARRLCIGCGACVALCPKERLELRWTDHGTYEVAEEADVPCSPQCARCLSTCPFGAGNADEDELARNSFGSQPDLGTDPAAGCFLRCFVGHSARGEQRRSGSSGGVASWFLSELLRRDVVDRVGCVVPCAEAASRSAYYPVELSAVLREIIKTDGRYALIGLPCFVKAVRLACAADARLRSRIVAVVGLVCGHGVSSLYAEFVSALAGASAPDRIERITFRLKDPERPAGDPLIEVHEVGRDAPRTLHQSDGPGESWAGWWFAPHACLFCDDVFAECADVTLMDAWLPEHSQDWRGTNLVIVRSQQALGLFEDGRRGGGLQLQETGIEEVVASQRPVVADKRIALAHRLHVAKEAGQFAPEKRVGPSRYGGLLRRRHWERQMRAASEGAHCWCGASDVSEFRRHMLRVTRGTLPERVVRKIAGVLTRAATKAGRILKRVRRRLAAAGGAEPEITRRT